jgi:hypothetical protein
MTEWEKRKSRTTGSRCSSYRLRRLFFRRLGDGFTGLTQTPPLSDAEAESYSELWNYPKPENTPQMNRRKNPEERAAKSCPFYYSCCKPNL